MNLSATLLFYISFASLAEVIVAVELPSIELLFQLPYCTNYTLFFLLPKSTVTSCFVR